MNLHLRLLMISAALIPLQVSARQNGTSSATINIQASSASSTSQQKKYFVEVYSLPKVPSADTAVANDPGNCNGKKCQTLSLPDIADQYLPEPPFSVNAKASSGLPVTLTVAGNATALGDTITVVQPGTVIVTAKQDGDSVFAAAVPVVRSFKVFRRYQECLPPLLPSDGNKTNASGLDPSSVIGLLGNPDPFSFQAAGKDKMLIYSSKSSDPNQPGFTALKKSISSLINAGAVEPSSTPANYTVELTVPHALVLGDIASLVNSLNYSDFSAQDIGKDKVRITSSAKLTCQELTSFYRDLRDLIWRPLPESPVQRVYYLNAPDLVGALGSAGTSSGPTAGSSASPGNPTGSSTTTPGSNSSGTTSQAANTSAGSKPGGTSSSSTNAAGTGSPSVQSASSAGNNPSAQTASQSSTSSSGSGAGIGSSNSGTSPLGTSAVALGADFLVFSEPNPGDDATVTERKRVIAALDLPRPEMIINVWSSQKSSKNEDDVERSQELLQETVSRYNEGLQAAVDGGWSFVKQQMDVLGDDYFDPGFRQYISQKYVADGILTDDSSDDPYFGQHNSQEIAQGFIDYRLSAGLPDGLRRPNGLCGRERYCLGYINLFRPLKPRITDVLLTAFASQHPENLFEEAIDLMEQRTIAPPSPPALEQLDPLDRNYCELQDRTLYRSAIQNLHAGPSGDTDLMGRPLYIECFRQTVQRLLGDMDQPTALGLVRAAIVDFLFQYKLSQQYPHEFSPYEMQQSAQTLNNALGPFIDSFNRDVRIFQSLMISEFEGREAKHESGSWFGSEPSVFGNHAIITVRTISGFDTTVSTTTSNFLDATQQPAVSDLLKSITGSAAGSSSSGSGNTSGNSGSTSSGSTGTNGSAPAATTGHMTNLLQNISPIQAQVITGALNAVQSSKIQIGPSLSIDVTPRSLSGASSAEIIATIKADTAANPTYFGGAKDSQTADISRVAQHDTTTHVRVDSIKLFEISTLDAMLEKSRTRFPLLPPFVEIPYIGTVLGVPLPVAKEYHTSSVVLSAIVIPTAADIVASLKYMDDRVVTSTNCKVKGVCKLKAARTLSDLHSDPIIPFHRRMVECFAEGGWSTNPSSQPGAPDWHNGCEDLTFDVLQQSID